MTRFVLLVPALSLLLSADVIQLRDGSSLTGDITVSSARSVQVRIGGQTREIPIRDIDSIRFQSAAAALAPPNTTVAVAPPLSQPQPTAASQDAEDFTIRLDGCAKQATASVHCRFSAVNHRADRLLSFTNSYMVDSGGLEQRPRQARLGNGNQGVQAVYNTSIPGEVEFGGVTPDVERIAKLSLTFNTSGATGNSNFELAWRNVPLPASAAAPANPLPGAAPASSFFPKRPPNAILHTATGVLVDYGLGNKSGGFRIRQDGTQKNLEFSVGDSMRMNRHEVHCAVPPSPGFQPSKAACAYWPPEIVIGKTRVQVTYWSDKSAAQAGNVSDQIDSAPAVTSK